MKRKVSNVESTPKKTDPTKYATTLSLIVSPPGINLLIEKCTDYCIFKII